MAFKNADQSYASQVRASIDAVQLFVVVVSCYGRFWPEPFIRVAEICMNPMAAFWCLAVVMRFECLQGGCRANPPTDTYQMEAHQYQCVTAQSHRPSWHHAIPACHLHDTHVAASCLAHSCRGQCEWVGVCLIRSWGYVAIGWGDNSRVCKSNFKRGALLAKLYVSSHVTSNLLITDGSSWKVTKIVHFDFFAAGSPKCLVTNIPGMDFLIATNIKRVVTNFHGVDYLAIASWTEIAWLWNVRIELRICLVHTTIYCFRYLT